MKKIGFIALVFAVLAACAPAAGSEGISVAEAWVRAPGAAGGAYMLIRNDSAQPDRLLSASSAVAEAAEVHEMTMENDVMKMREVEGGLVIPARGSVELAPGGYHIMLINLKQALTPGETVVLTLNFERAGPLEVLAEVRAP